MTKLPCTMRDSIIRNLPLAAGIILIKVPLIGWIIFAAICILELALITGSEDSVRIGDMLANTTVVSRDNKTEEKQMSKFASMEGQS